jgi:hypothetical protein
MVGDWKAIEKGDADGRATMAELFGGEATLLPLRDPISLEPTAPPDPQEPPEPQGLVEPEG